MFFILWKVLKWTYRKTRKKNNEERGGGTLLGVTERLETHLETRSSLCLLNFHGDFVMDPVLQYTLGWVLSCMCIILLPVTGARWSYTIFPKTEGQLSVRLAVTDTNPIWAHYSQWSLRCLQHRMGHTSAYPLSCQSFAVVANPSKAQEEEGPGRKDLGAGWPWASTRVRMLALCLRVGFSGNLPL